MAVTSPDPYSEQPDDRHFLRTGAESETGNFSTGETPAVTCSTSSGAMLWPLPSEVEAHLAQMKQWHRMAVLAIRIDRLPDAEPPNTLRTSLKQLLTRTAGDHGGIWFPWQPHGYGLVLSHADTETALSAAQALQLELSGRHVHTISFGITEFPLNEFDQRQSLINACKALDHGAFFGPGTCTLFDAVSLNISGDRYYQAADLDGALHEYRTALALDEANVNVRNSLGVCLAEKGDLASARTAFETVCRIHGPDAMALFNIGLIDLQQGLTEQAADCFEKAYAADPNTFEIPYQLGKLLFEQDRTEQAMNYLQAAQQIRDNHAPLHALIGQCLTRMGQITPAIAAFKKAIKLNPNDAASLSELGTLYAQRGENTDICITFCRQSVLIAPQNGLFRYRLARLHHDFHQWDQALEQYEQAAELGQDVADHIAEIRDQLTTAQNEKMRCA